MPSTFVTPDYGSPVKVLPAPDDAQVLVVCEHASPWAPDALGGLGLRDDLWKSHIAWDPGALGVAEVLRRELQAPLVFGTMSRLVYDLNRPPDAVSAVPEVSEHHGIPGNARLSPFARRDRMRQTYLPFRRRLDQEIDHRQTALRLLVTVHSFTPVFLGEPRVVQLGLLHGRDPRFAQAMLDAMPASFPFRTELNAPYTAQDGVAHTLDIHGCDNGLLNVMLEIRNDLIATPEDQHVWGALLAPWIADTLQGFAADWEQEPPSC